MAFVQTIGMINGRATTIDWQTFTGQVCVLPIGSFEQHGHHLPLNTDILCAEYFAQFVATEIGAALLPPLSFGTCMEHTGFRGSISLRPETLMQVVRDVAEEVERQNFRILIVINGHGGNFALGPVVRDINRRDGTLKVLLFDWWEVVDPSIANEGREKGMDIHAGEMETSLMMALWPDLVKGPPVGAPECVKDELPLTQRDLNTFGTGHFSPAGPIGFPAHATAEKGQAILACVREKLIPLVRDRVRRVSEQPRYAGRGAITLRPLTPDDLPEAMRLKTLAGWNQTADDWRIFWNANPELCLAAVHNGQVIGTTTAIGYGADLAWVGMVLVDPAFRRMGIGRLMLKGIMEKVDTFQTVRLDATLFGKDLYTSLGFEDEYEILRMVRPALPFRLETSPEALEPLTAEHMLQVAELDAQVMSGSRLNLLASLREGYPSGAFVANSEGELTGFCLGRPGANYHQIGPVTAASFGAACALTEAALTPLSGRAVVMDVPKSQNEMVAWLTDIGFSSQRSFVRMVRGGTPIPTSPPQQFAVAGPELG